LCDFGFGSPGCGAYAPLFQQVSGHVALIFHLAEGLENRTNRIYEAGVGVKRKLSKLCPGRHADLVAGDSKTIKFRWLTI